MLEFIAQFSPAMQALIATLFTWLMTAVGAASVFTAKNFNQKVLDGMLGLAGGVMIAASFWSLLSPAIEMAEASGKIAWVPAAIGFLCGGLFIMLFDKILPHLHPMSPMEQAEGIHPERKRRSTLLVLAITMHNIPEGLAIGVAFGSVTAGYSSASLAGALALAIGIGIQNLPEGVAVAVPLRREGMSRTKSFWYGQLSGMVEPFAAVIGALAVVFVQPLLPYALSFAAGAMIFVVAEEVIPSSHENGNHDLASLAVMIGFAIMMILDVALG
ncbi:MAG TPA: ZIP family metal transporter [Bacillales bacterium]|nr:ZIP family metal transporter [Bacillales bacterium]